MLEQSHFSPKGGGTLSLRKPQEVQTPQKDDKGHWGKIEQHLHRFTSNLGQPCRGKGSWLQGVINNQHLGFVLALKSSSLSFQPFQPPALTEKSNSWFSGPNIPLCFCNPGHQALLTVMKAPVQPCTPSANHFSTCFALGLD